MQKGGKEDLHTEINSWIPSFPMQWTLKQTQIGSRKAAFLVCPSPHTRRPLLCFYLVKNPFIVLTVSKGQWRAEFSI